MKKLGFFFTLVMALTAFGQTNRFTNIIVSGNSQLGTVTSGTWNASILSTTYGGLGANNSAATGVPVFLAGVNTFTATIGTGSIVRATAPTIADPTFTGTTTLGGASAATIDFPNAGDTNYTASGGGTIIWAPPVRFNGGIKDSAGSLGTNRYVLMSDGSDIVWRVNQVAVVTWSSTAVSTGSVTTTPQYVGGANFYRSRVAFDASAYTQARIYVTVGSSTPVDQTIVYAKYLASNVSTSTTFSDGLQMGAGGTDVQVLLGTAGNRPYIGSWTNLVAGAMADIAIDVGIVAPSGSTAIALTQIIIQFR